MPVIHDKPAYMAGHLKLDTKLGDSPGEDDDGYADLIGHRLQ